MSTLNIGIVGSGMIAGVIAKAIQGVETATLAAVASRRPESAGEFAREHKIPTIFATWEEMVGSDLIDAVYVATPTAVKEEISITAADNGKHILVDKPFASLESLEKIIAAAQQNKVAFMDATHFPNHPRTHQIKSTAKESIGEPIAVRTNFFFPFLDRKNIRFNVVKEPTGAVGDMAWYSMRAVAEYLAPTTDIRVISGAITRDKDSGAVIKGSGLIVFEDDKSTTFDFGYNAGVCLMDLDILGSAGMFHIDDFVLDWKDGFAFDNPNHKVGYTKRSEMQSPDEFEFIEAGAAEPQTNTMIRNFVRYALEPGSRQEIASTSITRLTQSLLDRFWQEVSG